MFASRPPLAGRRVLITGAARGIGAALARRLHERGARVALVGLEPELLEHVANECGNAPWHVCDGGDRAQVDAAVDAMTGCLGGLDVVVANAGIAAQLPLVGGDPSIMERTLRVNVLGAYYTLRSRRIVAPRWVGVALPLRMAIQPLADRVLQRGLDDALRVARADDVASTTPQPARGD